MNNTITIRLRNYDCDFILEEKENGDIVVQVPYIVQGENFEDDIDYIDFNDIEIKKGKKEQMVRQFFEEDSPIIVRNGLAYNIETVLFDKCELPESVEPGPLDN